MSQIKISELDTLAQQLVNADYVPIVHTGVTYKFAPFNYLVKNSGNETIAGVKTFSSTPIMTVSGGSASAVVDTIIVRKDTAANWTATNPTLHQGEKAYETDTGKGKTGDGVTAWNSLAYDSALLSSTPSAGKVMVWGYDDCGLTGLLQNNNIYTISGVLPVGTTQILALSSRIGVGCIIYMSYYETTGGAQKVKLFIADSSTAAEVSSTGTSTAITSIAISGGYVTITTDKQIDARITMMG